MTSARARWTISLGSIVILFGLFLFSLWRLEAHQRAAIEENVIASAESQLRLLESFRTLYTSEVVARLPAETVEVSHEYRSRDAAVPLPATLTIQLAEHVGRQGTGIEAQLFSEFPFPWRADGRRLDQFETDALAAFAEHPQTPYFVVTDQNGSANVRYAKADLMRLKCVSCHNSHPSSPKTDWKVGDVRGALSITVPIRENRRADSGTLRDLLLAHLIVALVLIAMTQMLISRSASDAGEPSDSGHPS